MKTKKKKKPSWFGTMWNAFKDARRHYKAQIHEIQEKHKLLSSHSDWTMIEKWVQECNSNPDLKVTIRLNDGTIMQMSCYKPQQVTMDRLLNDITVEE